MKALRLVFLLALSLLGLHCGHVSRLEMTFDQICELVSGKTAAEVESLLGPPDTRQQVLVGDERWIWWNYTYLDGEEYAPEVRGRVVHLEITFRNPSPPSASRLPYSEWRIVSPYGVSYSGLLSRNAVVPLNTPLPKESVTKSLLKGDPRP